MKNFTRTQFSYEYMDAADCGHFARLARAEDEVFDVPRIAL